MIVIDNTDQRLDAIASQYYLEVKRFFKIDVVSKSLKVKRDKLENLFYRKSNLEAKMIRFLRDNLEEIILCNHDELLLWHKKFISELKINLKDQQHRKHFTSFKTRMEHYYSGILSKSVTKSGEEITIGRWLSKSIDIKVCPYCNHNYTLAVNDRPNTINFRPDFDHFSPKSIYPLLALSFFNLVPSCSVCNKLKSNKEVKFSPYNPATKNAINFSLYGIDDKGDKTLLGLGSKYNKILLEPTPSVPNLESNCNVKSLGIQQIYDHQIDYVQEIVDKAQEYNKDSYKGMIESFNGLGKTEAEIDRIIWGVYLDEHSKRPLSKLTNDVLVQLGLKK